MTDGPFRVVTRWVHADSYGDPDAKWQMQTREYDTELDAIHAWGNARMYANIEPVSITPEPEWSKYVQSDGKTPVTK